MGTYTTNYNLFKPAGSDFIDEVVDLNANWDIVDTQIKARADATATEITNRTNADNALDARITALENPTRRTSGDLGITAAANWAITQWYSWEVGKLRIINAVFTYSGGNITAGTSGNITDTSMLNALLPANYRPAVATTFVFRKQTNSAGSGHINSSGDMIIDTLDPTDVITSGDTINLTTVYGV